MKHLVTSIDKHNVNTTNNLYRKEKELRNMQLVSMVQLQTHVVRKRRKKQWGCWEARLRAQFQVQR